MCSKIAAKNLKYSLKFRMNTTCMSHNHTATSSTVLDLLIHFYFLFKFVSIHLNIKRFSIKNAGQCHPTENVNEIHDYDLINDGFDFGTPACFEANTCVTLRRREEEKWKKNAKLWFYIKNNNFFSSNIRINWNWIVIVRSVFFSKSWWIKYN